MQAVSSSRERWITELIRTTVVLASCILLLALFLSRWPEFNGAIKWKDFSEINIGSLLALLIFLSLALQSTLEVFVSNFRYYRKYELVTDVNTKTEIVAQLKSQKEALNRLSEQSGQGNAQIYVNSCNDIHKQLEAALQKLSKSEDELSHYRNRTKSIINFAGLLAGIIISIGGLRVLQSFIADITLHHWQKSLFHTVDILLTAGLISGGSEGVSRIVSIYKNLTYFASLKLSMPNTTPPQIRDVTQTSSIAVTGTQASPDTPQPE